VLVRTTEWWASQATARVLVVNCWLPVGFQRRPGQVILQTWHGTPYKTLGLDRLGEPAADAAKAAGLRRHAGLWDLLLAQNAYSAGIFARAYGFDRDPLLVGYPRNDRLVPGYPDAELARVRRRLGVGDGTRLVLYAPTFRDDDPGLFRGLDLTALGRGLGPGHVTMVRGHGNTVRHDRAVELPGVVDVTLYPDLAELFAVADVLVTDYSSAMFDFAITGKPLVFFVPDLARYTGSIRGSYFDLAAEAPGPLTVTSAETVEAVRAALAGERSTETARRYLHWQERYLSTELGTATTRTVDALLAAVDAAS
jgi:CDP-glycerol glycerophosphotransferase (TagB/SpsB family)